MKKLIHKFLLPAFAMAALALIFLSQPVHAASSADSVLVLPFQANAGPDLPNAQQAIPEMILRHLRDAGLSVVPMNRATALLRQSNLETVNLETARRLGRSIGAKLVIYGAFNQLGDGFTMETRMAPVEAGEAIPASFERQTLLALDECAENIAKRAADSLGASRQAAAPPQSESGFVPMSTPSPTGGLSDVQVRGTEILDPDTVLMRLTIRKGDRPDAQAINDEVKRIWDMGYFSDVQAHMQGDALIFTVVEKPRIDNIIVQGNHDTDAEDVIAAMGTKPGSVLNEEILADDLQKVAELYHKEGYYLAKANYHLQDRPGNRGGAVLVIDVEEGNKLYIKDVVIEGLEQIDKSDMDKYLALRPRHIFSWLTGSGVLKDEYLERDANAIAAYGLNEGFMDIQVAAPDVKYDPDGIVVTFVVHEGPRYKLRDIKFGGDIIDDEGAMLEIVELDDWRDKNEYFSLSVMQEDTKRLTDFYGDHGYAFAEVDTKVMKAEDGSNQVDIGYLVDKKNKVFIRRVSVEGNTKTRDNVILREMRLGDGDVYEGAKMRRSAERLNRLRYFSAVDMELVPTENPDEVDLKVKVKEAPTGALMGGIGYSTYYDVGVTASIMERNLFGRGYWLQLQGFFSWRRTSGVLSFTNPRVYDTDLSLGNDLYYTHDYWDDFSKDTLGDTIRAAYPLGEYTTFGLSYRLERYELYDVDANSSPYISDYKGINWTSALSARLTRDTTNSRERPTQGTITRLWAEYGGGGLGGTDNFIKAVADWQGFYSFNEDNTFHLRARVGGVFQNSDEPVPVFERFWIGGMESIRGYAYSDISPRDYKYGGEQIGGDRMGVLNVEYIWRFEPNMGLALVPFFDAGFNVDSKTMGNDWDKYIVYSTGLELRWRSPMGDLRIAYGIPLIQDYDGEMESGRLEFSMGQFF